MKRFYNSVAVIEIDTKQNFKRSVVPSHFWGEKKNIFKSFEAFIYVQKFLFKFSTVIEKTYYKIFKFSFKTRIG